MNRRTLLTAASASAVAGLAGCTTLASPTTLAPTVEADGHFETHLQFGPESDRLATVSFRRFGDVPSGEGRLEVIAWHRPGTRVERLDLSVRAPPEANRVPATLELAVEGDTERADVSFSRTADDAPLVSLSNLGAAGDDNVSLSVRLRPFGESPTAAAADVTALVREPGLFDRRHRCEGGALLRFSSP